MNKEQLVDYLNNLLELDRGAISRLIGHRTQCNKALADHPTVQVSDTSGVYGVGLLGILNGLFPVDNRGFGAISAIIEDDGTVIRFE